MMSTLAYSDVSLSNGTFRRIIVSTVGNLIDGEDGYQCSIHEGVDEMHTVFRNTSLTDLEAQVTVYYPRFKKRLHSLFQYASDNDDARQADRRAGLYGIDRKGS